MGVVSLLRLRPFAPVVASLLGIVVATVGAAAFLWFTAPVRDWRYVRAHGTRVTGTVVANDRGAETSTVGFTAPADGRRHTETIDGYFATGTLFDVLTLPGHPAQLVDESYDPRPSPPWIGPSIAAAAGLALLLLLLGYVAALARAHRRRLWRQVVAQAWTTKDKAFVSVFPVGTAPGEPPQRTLLMLWDDDLPTIGPADTVEASGHPEQDAVLVLRRGTQLFWPVAVGGYEPVALTRAAPALGAVPPSGAHPTTLRARLARGYAGAGVIALLGGVPALGRLLGWRLYPDVLLLVAAVGLGAAAGIPFGWAPLRLAAQRTVAEPRLRRSLRRVASGRPPWYVTVHVLLAGAAVLAGVAVAATWMDDRATPDVSGWRDLTATTVVAPDTFRTERVGLRYQVDGREYTSSVPFRDPTYLQDVLAVRVDPRDPRRVVVGPGARSSADDLTGAFYVADVALPGALVLGFVWLVVLVIRTVQRGG